MGYSLTEINIPNGEDLFNPVEIPREPIGETTHNQISEALADTLFEVRAVRDKVLADNPCSKGGLVLGQLSLIITRLAHGISASEDDFRPILRACELFDVPRLRRSITLIQEEVQM